ncbi:MAG: HAMP domain-containing protein [Alphaproteobacteria bacterium]|nr:HAMP domain-containing protein [Alphaproteobacteria bacterium]
MAQARARRRSVLGLVRLDHLPIPVRLYGGYAIVLALIVGLGISSVLSLREMQEKQGAVKAAIDIAGHAGKYGLEAERAMAALARYAASEAGPDANLARASKARADQALTKLTERDGGGSEKARRERTQKQFADVQDKAIAGIAARAAAAVALLDKSDTLAAAVAAVADRAADFSADGVKAAARFERAFSAAMVATARALRSPTKENLETATAAVSQLSDSADALQRGLMRSGLTLGDAGTNLRQGLEGLKEDLATFEESALAYIDAFALATRLQGAIKGQVDELSSDITTQLSSDTSAMESVAASAERIATWAPLAALAVAILLANLLGRSIVKPVKRITGVMQALTDGNLAVAVTDAGRRDEIGVMAGAVETFKRNAQEMARLRDQQEAERQSAEVMRRSDMRRLADDFEGSVAGIVNNVREAADQVRSSARSLSDLAQRTSERCLSVSTAAEQATRNVSTVAAATEELNTSIGEIARQVAESTGIAESAMEEAARTNKTVAGLSEAAGKIGDVVKLISDIAAQTNLLALNATIEAARAGDAGKGFAVVAAEVKNLATQTGKATDEVGQQVGIIQVVAREAAGEITRISQIITRMSEIATTVASAVEQQTAATREIARNAEQASLGTSGVASTIQGVSEATEETGAAATGGLAAAESLTWQAGELSGAVEDFLKRVRGG